MRHRLYFITLVCASMAATLTSCDRDSVKSLIGEQKNQFIKVNVLSSGYIGTRSEKETAQEPVLASVYGDEDFSISEYVCDIEDVMATPGTRGPIITKNSINSNGQSFTVDGWGMISPKRGEPQVLTNHLPKLTANCSGSGDNAVWSWTGGANPKWANESNLHIWSYYPAGKINPTITIDNTTPANNTAKFIGYTTDNTDLLIAYNNEYREFETDAAGNHTYNEAGEITDDIIGEDYFNVHFYHALAAIEFKLNTPTTGADVHSITICNVNTDKTISTTTGIASTGDCIATGSGIGSGSVSFVWNNLNNRKPLHCEFGTGQSVAGGYTSATGNGVLFIIPQELPDDYNMKIIVEFSKNGSTDYYTRVLEFPTKKWEAGYYYKYQLSVGEFHVPGEKMPQLTNVAIPGLKPKTGTYSFKRPLDKDGNAAPIPIKGVTKMGLSLKGYGLGAKPQDNQTVYMYCNKYGSDNSLSAPGDGFQFNFTPVTAVTGNSDLFTFGTDNTSETYYNCYSFTPTEDQTKNPESEGVPKYYVFDTAGETEFLLYFKPSAGDNSGGFIAELQGLIVLEVAIDPNIPSNFPLNVWP